MTDIHIMGLPLSITNRIRCKGVPSSEGLPEQEMGFFHRISAFKANRIRINCVTLSNENGFADQGSPPPPPKRMGFASRWSPPIFKRFLVSETTRGILRLHKWSVERETPIKKGFIASPSHQGRLRLQVDNVHNQLQTNLEISMSDVLT